MAHDASATWSGFNYQGKVALYHSLKLIIQKISNQESLDGFNLILENNEDFDISGPNGFESFHQVKAVNQTAYSKFEDAIFEMLLQLDQPRNSSVRGYLHTWRDIRWQGDQTFRQKLMNTAQKVVRDQVQNPGACIITKALNLDHTVPKIVKIIRHAKSQDTRLADFASIESVVQNIANANVANSAVDRLTIYDYGNQDSSCDINQIDSLVSRQIVELLNQQNVPNDNTAVYKIFCKLLKCLDENIIQKHLQLNSGALNGIPLSEIFEIAINTDIRDSDEAFLASQFKLKFVSTFEEFLDDEDLCPLDVAESYLEGTSRLNSVMDLLLAMPALELLHYYKNLSPQIEFEGNNVIGQALETDFSSIRNFFFLIFYELCDSKLEHCVQTKNFNYISDGGRYRPTTIGNETRKRIVKKLMRSPNALVPLFETSALVSGDHNVPTIDNFEAEYSNQVSVDIEGFYNGDVFEEREKITQVSKNIRLININMAKQEVNDD